MFSFHPPVSVIWIVTATVDAGIRKSLGDMTNLPEAIRDVSRENIYVPPPLASEPLAAIFGSKGNETLLLALSVKGSIVARMIGGGLSIGRIAMRLQCSPRIICNQNGTEMKMIGVINDLELAAMVRDRN